MFKNPAGIFAALAATGAAGYYLLRSGGDPKVAHGQIRHDAERTVNIVNEADKVRNKADAYIQQTVKDARTKAKEADIYLEQAVYFSSSIPCSSAIRRDAIKNHSDNPPLQIKDLRDKASATDQQLTDAAKDSMTKLENYLEEIRRDVNSNVDEFDRSLEKQTAKARKALADWLGGGNSDGGNKDGASKDAGSNDGGNKKQ
ncbi:hypothetical protein EYZ11_012809 [Aspergillus tanneri]|uniref:Uncharacterized protein n=1 Tax=Aspergillus tanneri TaxID=1220188 RepID=A0A4S3J1E6_9EURO|nr:uncharacterized protein ATNIH1004_006656 [Aspergillus tanneri]KAA8645237.1 hypothetical protein ATNIH1004_006656 [Aspergillus tanneri]THC87747.1 hypothetical protein EYZ11_012809 [Aspergillus tanneri]